MLDQMFVSVMMDGWEMIVQLHYALASCPMKHLCAQVMVLASVLTSASVMMDGCKLIVLSLIASVSRPISHLFVLARASAPDRTSVCAMMDSGDTSVTSKRGIEL